jgi:undecaprenyl-diphosphatase
MVAAAPSRVPRVLSVIEAIILGILQGLTEFLPISSSGHLRIVPAFLGWEDPGAAFTAVIQLGTMAAEVIYFRHDLVRIGRGWSTSLFKPELRRTLDARMGWYLIFATIPIGVLGLAFEHDIETVARNLKLIGAMLIALGIILLVADRRGRHERGMNDLRLRDGLIMGSAQALALIPGVSRSGATITAGLFLGLERAAAARFSFLLSIPAVVLSGLFQLYGIVSGEEATDVGAGALILATIFAFITGYAAIAFLLRYLATHTTLLFVVYRVALGTVVLVLASSGVIK